MAPRPPAGMLPVLLAAPFLASADAAVVNVAAPAIQAGTGASGGDAQFVVGGYIVAYAVLLITGARLGQTHGYKRLFLAGVAAFGVCSLGAGLAPGIAVLIGARVLQGAAAAVMFPQALTGIQTHFSAERRTRAIGMFAAALSAGAVAPANRRGAGRGVPGPGRREALGLSRAARGPQPR